MSSLNLTLEQSNLLRSCFIASYGDFSQVRDLVRYKLGDRLTNIPNEIALGPGVAKVIAWAEQVGRLDELVAALVADRPEREEVRKLRAVLPAASSRRTIPRDLPYLCDWTNPITALRSIVPEAGQPRTPSALITLATKEDCPEAFLDRIRGPLEKFSNLAPREPAPLDWPASVDEAEAERLSDRVHIALDAAKNGPIHKKLPEGLTILRTNVIVDRWTEDNSEILSRYLRYWQRWPAWSGRRALMSQISVTFFHRNEMEQALETVRLCLEAGGQAVKSAVVVLPLVRPQDAINWLSLPEVRNHYRVDRKQDLVDALWAHFPQMTPLPMSELHGKLLDALERHP